METRDVKKMEESLGNLRKAIDGDNNFFPLLFRRECILLYFQKKNLAIVNNKILTAPGIPESAQTKIRDYLLTLKIK